MYHDVDIDECEDNYTCSYMEGTVCYNTPGNYDCLCPDGYIQCNDNNECTRELCRIIAVYIDTPPSLSLNIAGPKIISIPCSCLSKIFVFHCTFEFVYPYIQMYK